jgi:hypothetical protein
MLGDFLGLLCNIRSFQTLDAKTCERPRANEGCPRLEVNNTQRNGATLQEARRPGSNRMSQLVFQE